MPLGTARKQIMSDCPENFKETLSDWIDNLESDVIKVLCKLPENDDENFNEAKFDLEQIRCDIFSE